MRIARTLVPLVLTMALAGCAATPSTVVAPVAVSSPSPPASPSSQASAPLLPPEDPQALYPVQISAQLDHVVSLKEAQRIAAEWNLTPAHFSFANGCVVGEFAASRVDSAVQRMLENFGTEPQIVSFSVDYKVVDVQDFASFPRIPVLPTGRDDDFVAAPADCS